MNFHLKEKVAEDFSMEFGSEDHTFGPINVREHFPEAELNIGKNRLLEVELPRTIVLKQDPLQCVLELLFV